jgi:glycosyltransferase involved in cell wall biosynthesis
VWSKWWINGVVEIGAGVATDVVYTIMSPFESADASERLARHLGVPWIADLGDPWALDEMAVFPTGLHRRREVRRMRRSLRSAAAIVMSTPEAATELVRTFPELAAKPVLAIPNGYDAADFATPVRAREDGIFRIVHTGYLHTDLGLRQRQTRSLRRLLGGQLDGVEILTRSHYYLLQALQQLFEQEPELENRVELILAGVLSDADRALIADLDFVRTPGYLTHTQSLTLTRTADLLFLPMQKLPPGRRSTTVPGKTYEYLASGRPVLAAVPEGDARDILRAAGTAQICDPDDTHTMTEAIVSEFKRWERGDPTPIADPAVVALYDRRRIAGVFAEAFDLALRNTLEQPADAAKGRASAGPLGAARPS